MFIYDFKCIVIINFLSSFNIEWLLVIIYKNDCLKVSKNDNWNFDIKQIV